MRTMDCQNLRREIDEAAPGDLLSAFATRHIDGCPECRTFRREHNKLQALMAGLGTIEAPGDFYFRLRARLAGEKPGSAHFPLSSLSFGFRAAVVATLLVVFGSAVFLSLKTSRVNSLSANDVPPAVYQPGAEALQKANHLAIGITPASTESKPTVAPKRPIGPRPAVVASSRNSPKMGTREIATRPATLIKTAELNARAADFPIEASSQPMKVSLDNGRGSSRTISLPPVSFGSQRVLAQGTAPLMASARGSW